ncbi:hypothetical protein AAFN88_14945 [Pelagibius sp. CAU 1746]|uniref:hypothetical protein n=1 Tax=Pelagibius sp. CAU 1746 TaxID=3140370 RepID=UPI00325B0674
MRFEIVVSIVFSASLAMTSAASAGGADGGKTSNGMSASAVSASLDLAEHSPSFIEAAASLLTKGTDYVSSGVAKAGSITVGYVVGFLSDPITLISEDPDYVNDWGDFRDAVDVAVEAKEQGVAGFTTGGSAVRQGMFTVEELKEYGL